MMIFIINGPADPRQLGLDRQAPRFAHDLDLLMLSVILFAAEKTHEQSKC